MTKLTQGQKNFVIKIEISKYKQNRAAILFTLYIVEAHGYWLFNQESFQLIRLYTGGKRNVAIVSENVSA